MMTKTSSDAITETAPLRWGTGQRIDDRARGAVRIIAAAKLCFAQSGVASATIDQVAQQAGVSRRTVYRYFDSKESIILAVVEEQAAPFFEQMRDSLQALPEQNFRQALVHCVLFAVEKGPQMEGHQLLLGRTNAAATAGFYLRSTGMRNHLYTLLSEPFQRAQQAGEIDVSWRLEELLNWVGRLVYSFIQYPESPGSVERMVTRYLLPGPGE